LKNLEEKSCRILLKYLEIQEPLLHQPSVEDLKLELAPNLAKYKPDDAYRKDLSRRLEVAVKNDPNYIDKVGG